jgi:hypothetical protein
MTKTYDELIKLLDEKGSIPDEDAARLIKEHGPLEDEEKKKIASAIKMAKALRPSDDKDKGQAGKGEESGKDIGDKKEEASGDGEVTMDDYLLALSILDSDEASKEEKEKAQKAKDKFESQ